MPSIGSREKPPVDIVYRKVYEVEPLCVSTRRRVYFENVFQQLLFAKLLSRKERSRKCGSKQTFLRCKMNDLADFLGLNKFANCHSALDR